MHFHPGWSIRGGERAILNCRICFRLTKYTRFVQCGVGKHAIRKPNSPSLWTCCCCYHYYCCWWWAKRFQQPNERVIASQRWGWCEFDMHKSASGIAESEQRTGPGWFGFVAVGVVPAVVLVVKTWSCLRMLHFTHRWRYREYLHQLDCFFIAAMSFCGHARAVFGVRLHEIMIRFLLR